jgi:hypothetical protein
MGPLSEPASSRWTIGQRIGFRFLLAYLLLFFFPFPSGLVNPYWLGRLFNPLWGWLVPWVAGVLGITLPPSTQGGSGDSTFAYLRVLTMLILAALMTGLWSVLDRRRGDYRTLHSWTCIWLRYVLALCMLTYGSVKVFMVQFEPPGYGRLIQPLGEFSPMAFLWIFMGYSPMYTSFTGAAEVLGGALLFFRRTTTLGALIVAGVMANVVMLNVCYDVCVKLGSLHILLLALVLLAPDARRLVDFFVCNRVVRPADLGPYLGHKYLHRAVVGIKFLLISSLLIYLAWDTYTSYHRQRSARDRDPTPPDGWYRVLSLSANARRLPVLRPEECRWRTVSLQGEYVILGSVDGSAARFKAQGDLLSDPTSLVRVNARNVPIPGAAPIGPLSLTINDDRKATLRGVIHGREIVAELERRNRNDFPLTSRGFRWIIEEPYFR